MSDALIVLLALLAAAPLIGVWAVVDRRNRRRGVVPLTGEQRERLAEYRYQLRQLPVCRPEDRCRTKAPEDRHG